MYFQSRAAAGRLLARKLQAYRYDNVFVVCLGNGAVLVGREIAAELHAELGQLVTEAIDVPGESQIFGTVDHTGGFSPNKELGESQLEDYYNEFHSLIDQQKQERFHELNHLLGGSGLVERRQLQHYNVIIVSDGLGGGMEIDAVREFLKPVKTARIVVAAPVASVVAVDRLHTVADEAKVEGVVPHYLGADHYYEVSDIPGQGVLAGLIDQNVLYWR